MPRRPTPPPGEGGRPPHAPPQEAATPPVEKKKVDAAFWDKFKEFQTMPPETRFEAIRSFLAGYEPSHGEESAKRRVFVFLFAHPEWCHAAAVQERWSLDRQRETGHRERGQILELEWVFDEKKKRREDTSDVEKQLQELKAPWNEGKKQLNAKIIEILENASERVFPPDKDLAEEYPVQYRKNNVLFRLSQGTWQECVYGLQNILSLFRIGIRDEVEQVKWLGSMDDEKMKEVLWGFHDEWEKNGLEESALPKLTEEIRQWRKRQGKGE